MDKDEKLTRFKDIQQFVSAGTYQVNIPLRFIPDKIKDWENDPYYQLQLNPKFQRGHVWTEQQQIAFMEFLFKGGKSSRVIYFNKPSWNTFGLKNGYDDFVCVDGLQRLTAVLRFMNNEISVFGSYLFEFEDKIPADIDLIFNINDLQTEKEVLQWYIEINSGGTPHTDEEIERVKKMLEEAA